jgi:hypothetical protein
MPGTSAALRDFVAMCSTLAIQAEQLSMNGEGVARRGVG